MNHHEAKALVESIPGITPQLSQLTRTVAWCETNYGQGWKGAGAGSNNMGAITGAYKGASFQHKDSRYDAATGKVVQYTTSFRSYPSDYDGFADLASLLQTRYSAAVRATPDWPEVSRAMYGYYLGVKPKEAAITDHAAWLDKGWRTIARATGEEVPFTAAETLRDGGVVVMLALLAGVGIWLVRGRARRALRRVR